MSTALHSFIDIFDTVFGDGQEAVSLKKISIPIIQRDYAQGRRNPDIDRVRDRFLESLYKAVTKQPITLDFVYGDIDEKGVMTPLDGQQRLTTLFLLHWYAAKKENILAEEWQFLKKFSYETRYSARYFCKELVDFSPSFEGVLSENITNQSWFPLDWAKDPTISSMLVMLDEIDDKFKKVSGIWDNLKNNAVTFYFLPIKDMGLTDELYIKMNSRGKPLTQFEHFKAEFENEIRRIDNETAERIISKIDGSWTDLLWRYRSSDNTVDDEFLCYFRFVSDIICYWGGESPMRSNNDEFALIQRHFSSKNKNAKKNIETLESFFDCWCDISGYDTPSDFLESFMVNGKHQGGKIVVVQEIDIFKDCLQSYSDKILKFRYFPLNRIVLLYAITHYLRHKNQIKESEFVRRIRIINNLIRNSEDEISDRTDRNRIPAILKQVDAIMSTGHMDDSIENNFNTNQLREEKDKIKFLKQHPDAAENLFMLEDHERLYGQIGIVGLEHIDYANRFVSLFNCKLDNIDCALMSIGDYGQKEKSRGNYQYASWRVKNAWNSLFHKSANIGFEDTKNILVELLSTNQKFTDEILQDIVNSFILKCEKDHIFPWRYYYVKYPIFRPGSYGKLRNKEAAIKPYVFSVLQTQFQLSSSTYIPYLKQADEAHLSRDDMGQRLVYGDLHIICENNAFVIRKNADNSVVNSITILQNSEGIDTEDRIIKLKKYISKHFP